MEIIKEYTYDGCSGGEIVLIVRSNSYNHSIQHVLDLWGELQNDYFFEVHQK